jgi:hypothetical protein
MVARASCLWGNRASRLVDDFFGRQDARGPTAKMAVLLLKIFRRDCIQSVRCGVMLAKRKKWKVANNVSAELLGNEKFGFLS